MKAIALVVVALAGCKPLVKSSDGRIATPTPPGSGWTYEDDRPYSYESTLTRIKWMNKHAVGLTASESTIEPMSIESLCGRDWKAYFRQAPLT